jgi:hypothetical protein
LLASVYSETVNSQKFRTLFTLVNVLVPEEDKQTFNEGWRNKHRISFLQKSRYSSQPEPSLSFRARLEHFLSPLPPHRYSFLPSHRPAEVATITGPNTYLLAYR